MESPDPARAQELRTALDADKTIPGWKSMSDAVTGVLQERGVGVLEGPIATRALSWRPLQSRWMGHQNARTIGILHA